eukprot:snap_masked-scaffold_2-processed-gene-9.33-mRNA-1 protein AED:0.32 eAED:0.34 QI:0/-1/0/1/-1/1/1/0/361
MSLHSPLDYRSDTFTHPTPAMREAMSTAPVGDDVYGEDPTVNELEALCASILGKEAAIFLPTCTMANLAAVSAHCSSRFSELIIGDKQHIYNYEVGGSSTILGVHSNVLSNENDGTISLERLKQAIQPEDIHFPSSKLICLENTHNLAGGRILPENYIFSVKQLAEQSGLKVHLDGARFFNATEAMGVNPATLCKAVDSISICLSKGLSAPAGALLAGEKQFIEKARHARKAFGGGMRQAGVLAACGLIGLREVRFKLNQDNEHAKVLAKGISQIEGFRITAPVETNMFYVAVEGDLAEQVVNELERDGVFTSLYGTRMLRMVTHREVPVQFAEYTVDAFARAATKVFNLPKNVQVRNIGS